MKEESQIISIEVEDKPGVMARISSLFNRRGFNIASMTVANTNIPGRSVFTMTVSGDEQILEQIRKQCQKLIHVIKVEKLNQDSSVVAEFALVMLKNTPKIDKLILANQSKFNIQVYTVTEEHLVMGVTNEPEKIDEFMELLEEDSIERFIRSGKMALDLSLKNN